ncbi:hypothetical protein CYJ37_04630 [Bacillus sp. UMB0728]|nr:hypothetical protein CYJ37_04630 [Bacillus sp. UMB0728]
MEGKSTKRNTKWQRPILWGSGALLIIMVMLYFDKEKVFKEEKPPMPVITVGSTEVQAILGSYRWNDGLVEREMKDITKSLKYQHVYENEEMKVDFPDEGDIPVFIGKSTLMPNGKKFPDLLPSILGENGLFSEGEGIRTAVLQAYWKDGKTAEYYLPIKIEKQPQKEPYFPRFKGQYSIVIIEEEVTLEKDLEIRAKLIQQYPPSFITIGGYTDLQRAEEELSELNIKEVPSYILLDEEGEVFRSKELGSMEKFIDENVLPEATSKEGIVTEVNREQGFIKIDEVPFWIDKGAKYHTGQKLALKARYPEDGQLWFPILEEVRVLEEQDKIFNGSNWLSNESGKLSILAIGNKSKEKMDFLKKEGIKTVVKTSAENSLKMENGKELTDYTVFVFNEKELIFQTDVYDKLLKFLYSKENLDTRMSIIP